MSKFPLYSLPKLYGWHLMPKQNLKETGKIYKYFGANWWDLLLDKKLPLHQGKITIKTSKAHAIIFVNIGKTPVKMTNSHTGDVYNVIPGKRSQVNNTFDKTITFTSSKPKNMIHVTKIGNINIILLQVQEIKNGKSSVKNSAIFDDFMLMTGVPDKDQYLNTVGIEGIDAVKVKGWKVVDVVEGAKSDYVEMFIDHWDKVNPKKRKAKPAVLIPEKIHWIWLRLDPKKKKYGKLKSVFYKFMRTWIERNPTFEINIWTDNPEFPVPKEFKDAVKIRGPNHIKSLIKRLPEQIRSKISYLYYNHPNVGARSDTLRQIILYLIGGVYADINDACCLAPLKKLCKKFDYFIGLEPVVYVNNAIIASKPKHIICKCMLAWLADSAHDFVREWKDDYFDAEQDEKDDFIVSYSGPIAMTTVINGVFDQYEKKLDHSLILPSSWIYPNYWIPESSDNWLKPVSICAHFDRRDYLKTS